MTAVFELEGQEFVIINGGPGFPHSPAVFLQINCENQSGVDELWERMKRRREGTVVDEQNRHRLARESIQR